MMRPIHRRAVFAVAAVVLFAGCVLCFTGLHGGLVNAWRLPPVRDASTPEVQNGYTLLAVQRPEDEIGNFHYVQSAGKAESMTPRMLYSFGEENSIAGLWIKLPEDNSPLSSFHIIGHASSGEVFPLKASLSASNGSERVLFTSLPGCYPGHLRYIDVTISENGGKSARWRIDRLPEMQHVLSPRVTAKDTVSVTGVTLQLRASRKHGTQGDYVRCRLSPQITPGFHQWELSMRRNSPETEWMPFSSQREDTVRADLTDETAKQVIAFNHGAILNQFIQSPFLRNDHYVQIRGHLRQYETYDERVTFHDVQIENIDGADIFSVSQPQSLVTPSGIKITLPIQSNATFMHQGVLEDPGLLVEIDPRLRENSLPSSPLVKQFKRPVQIEVLPVKPMGLLEESAGPGALRKLILFVPPTQLVQPTKARDLNLIVRQRVDLQTMPVTLVAPITEKSDGNTQ